jgi:hypothetical protein
VSRRAAWSVACSRNPDDLSRFRLYHRKDGRVHKEGDDLMSATRYAIMMLRFAEIVNRAARKRFMHRIASGGWMSPCHRTFARSGRYRLWTQTEHPAAQRDLILANEVCCHEVLGRGSTDAIRSIEAARVHHAHRRGGNRLAAGGTRAAACETAYHRILGRDNAFGPEEMDGRFRTTTA